MIMLSFSYHYKDCEATALLMENHFSKPITPLHTNLEILTVYNQIVHSVMERYCISNAKVDFGDSTTFCAGASVYLLTLHYIKLRYQT